MEYYNLPQTQELLKHCRQEIVAARRKLAMDRDLTLEQRSELWLIIDARLWFVEMIARDYESELAAIDKELAAELVA